MSINNNNHYSSNNSSSNESLFFKVWRNKYLRSLIINHVNNLLYKKNYRKSYCTRYSLISEKYRQYIRKIEYSSNEGLLVGDFEEGVQFISITNNLSDILVPGVIPSTCTSLEFKEYNKPFQVGVIPIGVRKLSFGTYFTQSFDSVGILPNTLTELSFGGYFNSVLSPGIIPNSVTSLKINNKVQYGGYSKILSRGSIPSSVKKLVLNAQDLSLRNDSLPDSLTKLSLYGTLVEPIGPNILPQSLTSLSVNKLKESFTIGAIPNSVTRLSFKLFYDQLIQPQIIPNSVTSLKVSNLLCLTYGSIPPSVTRLHLNIDSSNSSDQFSLVRQLKPTLPPTASSLFSKFISSSSSLFGINNINSNNINNNQEIKYETIIPNSVQYLKYNIYRQLKVNEIPSSVTYLEFGPSFVYPVIPETIPSSIKTIIISKSHIINRSLHYALPTIKIIIMSTIK